MKILVDADSCPSSAFEILKSFNENYSFTLITVASFKHNISWSQHITVDDNPEAADMVIANKVSKNDIVVTGDWGLATLVLSRGAEALTPSGKIFNNTTIEFMLEERHLKEKTRRKGIKTKGPSSRTEKDDELFKEAFKKLLERQEYS